MLTLAAITCGYFLDLALGDPHGIPHPIILIGNLISFLEKRLRKLAGSDMVWQLFFGFVMVLIVLTLCFAVPYGILYACGLYSPWLRFVIETIMCYQIFAIRCLRDESMEVYKPLVAQDLPLARLKLSWIVGRDTDELSAEEVTKATVETVAENTADGIIAPMFYMFIGGAPLAFFYKGINTMDSMVGYNNDKYRFFGRCAAKLDDVANVIPARITAFLMLGSAYIQGLNVQRAWHIFKRDRYNHLSPNSAQTESVIAGILGVQLGGGHMYFGKFVPKKTIGDNLRPVVPEDIQQTNKVLYITSALGIFIFLVFAIIILNNKW